jgi:hypothetical protein
LNHARLRFLGGFALVTVESLGDDTLGELHEVAVQYVDHAVVLGEEHFLEERLRCANEESRSALPLMTIGLEAVSAPERDQQVPSIRVE